MSKHKAIIGGKSYQLVIGKVESKDTLGRPKSVTIIYDEESVDLKGGEEFVTLWMPEVVGSPKPKAQG